MSSFMKKKSGREVIGWKHPPSGWYPQIGLDHVIRGGKTLEEYVKGELKQQQLSPMKRKTGPVKRKKVKGKWIVVD